MNFFEKKVLCSIFVLWIFTSIYVTSVNAEYLPKDHTKSNNSSDIALIYTGYYDPKNYDGEEIGNYDIEKFLPYVGYLNDEGVAEDYFFDTFLMLATKSPYNGSLTRWYDWVENSKPGTLKDWEWAMDRMFTKNQQLDALNKAVKKVSSTLGDRNKQVNVYLTLPFPDPQSKDFGDFKSEGASANLESLEMRNEVVKWYIDTMVFRFNEQNYKHLKLAGFYWLQEDLDTTISGERENVKYAADYLNSQALRLGWIPWSGAGEKANGNKHGFDFTLVQPNHFFQADTTIERIKETAELSKANEQGIEIEFDLRAIENPHFRQVLNNYLIGGVKYDYMSESILAYYQDVYGIYDLYHHESTVGRKYYTDIYQFSKGEYVPPTGNMHIRVVDVEGNPLPNAVISDENGWLGTTDNNGKFTKDDIFSIKHSFRVSKDGYSNKSFDLDIPIGETVFKDIILGDPTGESLLETQIIGNFQGEFNVGGNNVVSRSLSTEKVYSGNQSLKVGYPNGWGPVRAFIDSNSDKLIGSDREYLNYTDTNWSEYDTLSTAVFNDTDKEQKLVMEFMYNSYSWSTSKKKIINLQPNQWNEVELPIRDLESEGVDTTNIIRMTLAMEEFNTNGATMYFDDITLRKYEKMNVVPEYSISMPSRVATMDIGSTWIPTVLNHSIKNEQGHPVDMSNVIYESTNPNIIEVTSDGKLKALKEGKASIRAKIDGVEAESVMIEVSPWGFDKLKGGNSILTIDKETKLTMQSFFENGYLIPWEDMEYEWSIIKKDDVITMRDNGNNKHEQIIKGVKNGKATIQVIVSYNGKTKIFTKDIKVKNNPKFPK